MARTLSTDERAWRDLAAAAMDANRSGGALLQLVKAVAGKTIPAPAHRDQAAFVALQALARACALGDAARRRRLSGCLKGVATECARAAEWLGEQPGAPADGARRPESERSFADRPSARDAEAARAEPKRGASASPQQLLLI